MTTAHSKSEVDEEYAQALARIVLSTPSGEPASDVGELTRRGYAVRLTCACGAAFVRWVTSDMANRDLLDSRLSVFPN